MRQGLQNDAILDGFFLKAAELFGRGGGRADIEMKADLFEADGNLPGNAEGAAKVEIAFDGDVDALGGNLHGGGDHLAGDLRAGGKSAEQHVPGTGGGAGSADSGVGLGVVNGLSDGDGAGDGSARLAALGGERDTRRRGIVAVLVLERFLKRFDVHETSAGALREYCSKGQGWGAFLGGVQARERS